jgi:alginate O-acetyltransferase complex protein AlgI
MAAWGFSSLAVWASYVLQSHLAASAATWLTIAAIFVAMKAIVLATAGKAAATAVGAWRLVGFVLLWPGMAIRPFVEAGKAAAGCPSRRLLQCGLLNAAIGAMILYWEAHSNLIRAHAWLRAAAGLTGAAMLIPFGLFQALAGFWRLCGVAVEKQWHFLPATRSLAEYWSARWNRCFHDFAREHVFRPLRDRAGSTAALFGSFLFSGVLHDLAISVPARGGYGLPTLYFALQGLGIWVERRFLSAGPIRRAWAALVLLATIGLLFHEPFLTRVVLPQLDALSQ